MKYLFPLGLVTFSAHSVKLSPSSEQKQQQLAEVLTADDVIEEYTITENLAQQFASTQIDNSKEAELNLAQGWYWTKAGVKCNERLKLYGVFPGCYMGFFVWGEEATLRDHPICVCVIDAWREDNPQ